MLIDLEDEVPGQEPGVPISNAARQDGFHHNASLLTPDDPKAEPSAVIDQVDHLHLTPVTGNDWVCGGEGLSPACHHKINSSLCLLQDCDCLLVGDVAVQNLQDKSADCCEACQNHTCPSMAKI